MKKFDVRLGRLVTDYQIVTVTVEAESAEDALLVGQAYGRDHEGDLEWHTKDTYSPEDGEVEPETAWEAE